MSDHVNANGTFDGTRLHLDDLVLFYAQLRQLDLGAGERVVVRVERENEAKRYHQLKWYYGYIVKQCCENGDTVPDMDQRFRGLFLPGDVETLSLMSYEQMRDFNIQCEEYAARVMGVVITGPDSARTYSVA